MCDCTHTQVFYMLQFFITPLRSPMSGSGGDNMASTSGSTSTAPASEVRQEIQALFDWNPSCPEPHFPASSSKAISRSSSKSTRPLAAYYDKHFPQKMRLHVRRLPSLVHQLQKNVDHTLLAASATLPRAWYPIGARQRDFTMNSAMSDVAMDEKAIAEIYGKTTAAFCVPLASTLALHPRASKDTWKILLLWTQSVSPSGYAIMDGELQIIR